MSHKTIIKGSLEEILPSYEKLRSVCVQVHDAKRRRLTVARVGTLGAARLRRGCGAVAAAAPVEIEALLFMDFLVCVVLLGNATAKR